MFNGIRTTSRKAIVSECKKFITEVVVICGRRSEERVSIESDFLTFEEIISMYKKWGYTIIY